MSSRRETDDLVKDAQSKIPLVFEPMGFLDGKVRPAKAAAWLTEMKGHFKEHR